MSVRFFTPGTARQALEQIRGTAETMCKIYRVMERVRPRGAEPDQPVDRGYFSMVRVFHRALQTLENAGVQVKDPRSGLVDFPAVRAGRVVLLCWRVGEPALGYWHESDAGFSGRQRVDEDGPWEERESPADAPS